jgi:hypothetical protein
MNNRIASVKETGEELSQEEWARFDAAVAEIRAERRRSKIRGDEASSSWRDRPKRAPEHH